VVPNRKTTKMIPRRETISGKERKKKKPLHISLSIQTTTIIIVVLTAALKIGVGSFIQS